MTLGEGGTCCQRPSSHDDAVALLEHVLGKRVPRPLEAPVMSHVFVFLFFVLLRHDRPSFRSCSCVESHDLAATMRARLLGAARLGLRVEVGGLAERLPLSVRLDARALGVADGAHSVAAKQESQRRRVQARDANDRPQPPSTGPRLRAVVLGWKRANRSTVAAYTGLSCAIVVEDPAKSVRKPPGSMIVTLMPSGPTSFARTSENPSTPNFAAAYAPRPTGPSRPPTDENWRICRFLSPHDGDRRLGHLHHAEEVRFDLCAEVLHARVLDRRQIAVAGVVREHVEPPKTSTASGPPRSRPARRHVERDGAHPIP